MSEVYTIVTTGFHLLFHTIIFPLLTRISMIHSIMMPAITDDRQFVLQNTIHSENLSQAYAV